MASTADIPTQLPTTPAPCRIAAIDIGTVTCRMLIADVDEGHNIHELCREYAITDLGEGVDETGMLAPQAIERVVSTLASYQQKIAQLEQPETNPLGLKTQVVALSTSAARDAKNASAFVDRVRDLGIGLTVIPGQTEAALSFAGATMEFPGEQVIVVDVGGGSTEVSAGAAGMPPALSHSFDIGCRRVTERFLHSDPPSAGELQAARDWIRTEMAPYFEALDAQGLAQGRMVAVAGTATSAVSIREKMEVYDSARVHKAQVSRDDMESLRAQLAAQPLAQRRATVGLDPKRAPVIVAGFIILEAVMDLLGTGSFTVSESDILQGIILRSTGE